MKFKNIQIFIEKSVNKRKNNVGEVNKFLAPTESPSAKQTSKNELPNLIVFRSRGILVEQMTTLSEYQKFFW